MALRQILTEPNEILRQKSIPVENVDSDLQTLMKDMLETMYAAPGIGLAAPQIGVQKRLFVYDWGSGPGVLINPEIRDVDGNIEIRNNTVSIFNGPKPLIESYEIFILW